MASQKTLGYAKASRLAGALAPWELGRYSPPCSYDRSGGVQLPVPIELNPNRLREIVAFYLGIPTKSEILDGAFSEDKITKLRSDLAAENQLSQHFVRDPLVREDPMLQAAIQSYGRPFTVGATPDAIADFEKAGQEGGVCEIPAGLQDLFHE